LGPPDLGGPLKDEKMTMKEGWIFWESSHGYFPETWIVCATEALARKHFAARVRQLLKEHSATVEIPQGDDAVIDFYDNEKENNERLGDPLCDIWLHLNPIQIDDGSGA
jgi:hypothetical protein